MDKKIIFVKTSKGKDEFENKTSHLFGDFKRALGLVDDKSTVEELKKRAAPSLRSSFDAMLKELVNGGFIQDKVGGVVKVETPKATPRMSTLKMAIPAVQPKDSEEYLDFTSAMPKLSKEALAAEEDKAQAQLAAQEQVRRAKFELQEKARAEADAKAKQEAEVRARAEAEAFRLKAEQEAAKVMTELHSAQASTEEEAEAKARAEVETARIKAERDKAQANAELAAAQAKAKQEAEAKARAEVETARIKAELEEAKLLAELAEAQAKTNVEAEAKARAAAAMKATHQAKAGSHTQIPEDRSLKARADDEARQLTESQARIWAEAEQRARMQAQQADAAQQMAQKTEKNPPAKVIPRVTREPRQPFPLGKISAGVLVLSLVLAVLLPYVWPMQDYITQIEQRLSAQLHQPVRIGRLRPSLLPLPKLEMQNVSVGSGQELKANSVVLNFNIAALFAEIRTIDQVEIGELTFKAETFDKALSWMQVAGGDANYPVTQMVLQRARISGAELNLPTLSGVVDFDGKGHLVKTVLSSDDGKFTVHLQPQQTRWQIALAIKESSLPLVPGIMFGELNVKGEVGAGEANFSVIEGLLYKGKLLGSARLTWKNGWQLQGQLNVKSLALQEALPQLGINGEMDGNASFALRGAQLPLLVKTPHLDGRLAVRKGFINSIDMVETVRVANRQGSASTGRTHFDELTGNFLLDGNSQQLRQIRISAGVMSANGFVGVVSGKQLSGRLNVDLKMRAEMGSMPLTLSGTLTEPVWRTRR